MKALKTVTIVIRGCLVRVDVKKAEQLRKEEQLLNRKDWRNNMVD